MFAVASGQSFLHNRNEKKFWCAFHKNQQEDVQRAPKETEKMVTVFVRKGDEGCCFVLSQTQLKSPDPVVPSPSVQFPIHPTQQYRRSSKIFWVDGAPCPPSISRKKKDRLTHVSLASSLAIGLLTVEDGSLTTEVGPCCTTT
jgi:hypothetical protein